MGDAQKNIEIDGITFTLHYKSKANDNYYDNTNKTLIDCIENDIPKAISNLEAKKSLPSYEKDVININKQIERLNKTLQDYRMRNEVYIDNKRDLIHFSSTSNGTTTKLNAYRSISELGLWRLAYLDNPNRGGICLSYDKMTINTKDYVQSTLIHPYLQKFFTEHFNSLPVVPRDQTDIKLSKTEVFTQDRDNIQMISIPFPTTDEIKEIDNKNRRVDMSPFKDLKIGKCGDPIDHSDRAVIKQFKEFSDSLEEIYERVDIANREIIYNNKFTSFVEGINHCNITMYKIILKDKSADRSKDVVLIYCQYELNYGRWTTSKVFGYFGVTLLPSDSIINKYGIYTKFISADKYICKPVEYQRQCKNIQKKYECTKSYAYIGYLYNDIFPYNQLSVIDKLPASELAPEEEEEPQKFSVYEEEDTLQRTDGLVRTDGLEPYNLDDFSLAKGGYRKKNIKKNKTRKMTKKRISKRRRITKIKKNNTKDRKTKKYRT